MTKPHEAGLLPQSGEAWFATTHWSVVLAAADQERPEAVQALETLCRTYWYPLYAYARRQGSDVADAQDLTQGFFAHILSRGFLKRASPSKGKFRRSSCGRSSVSWPMNGPSSTPRNAAAGLRRYSSMPKPRKRATGWSRRI